MSITNTPHFERYKTAPNNTISSREIIADEENQYYRKLELELRQNSQFKTAAQNKGLDPNKVDYEIKQNGAQTGVCLFRDSRDPGIYIEATGDLAKTIKKFSETSTSANTPSTPPKKLDAAATPVAIQNLSQQSTPVSTEIPPIYAPTPIPELAAFSTKRGKSSAVPNSVFPIDSDYFSTSGGLAPLPTHPPLPQNHAPSHYSAHFNNSRQNGRKSAQVASSASAKTSAKPRREENRQNFKQIKNRQIAFENRINQELHRHNEDLHQAIEPLNRERDQLQEQLNTSTIELKKRDQLLNLARSDLKQLRERAADLEEFSRRNQEKLDQQQQQYTQLQTEHEQAKQALIRLQKENPDLQHQLEIAHENISRIEKELEASTGTNASLRDQLQQAQQDVAQLQAVDHALAEEKNKVSGLDQQLADQKQAIETLNNQLRQSEQTLQEQAQTRDTLDEQLAQAQANLKDNVQLIEEKSHENSNLSARIHELENRQGSDSQELTHLRQDLEVNGQNLLSAQTENGQLHQQVEALQYQHERLQERHKKSALQISELGNVNGQLLKEREELTAAHEQAKAKLLEAEKRVDQLGREAAQLRSQVPQLKQKLAANEAKISEITSQRERLQEDAATLISELKQKKAAQETLAQNLQSTQKRNAELQQQLEADQLKAKDDLIQAQTQFDELLSQTDQKHQIELAELQQKMDELTVEVDARGRMIQELSPPPNQDIDTQTEEISPLPAEAAATVSLPEEAPIVLVPQDIKQYVRYLKSLGSSVEEGSQPLLKKLCGRDYNLLTNLESPEFAHYKNEIDHSVKGYLSLKRTPRILTAINAGEFPMIAAFVAGLRTQLNKLAANPISLPKMNEEACDKMNYEYKCLIIACFLHCALTLPTIKNTDLYQTFNHRALSLIKSFKYDEKTQTFIQNKKIDSEKYQTANGRPFMQDLLIIQKAINARRHELLTDESYGKKEWWIKTMDDFLTSNLSAIGEILKQMIEEPK